MITSFVYEEMGVEGGVKHLNLNLYLNCSRTGEGKRHWAMRGGELTFKF